MKALTTEEIAEACQQAPGWQLAADKLVRQWTFPDFVQAMAFVNEVAGLAEKAGHHPDIDIRYNRVTLGLITHDANGITRRDAAMAARLSEKFPPAS